MGPGVIPLGFDEAMSVQIAVTTAVELDSAHDGHLRCGLGRVVVYTSAQVSIVIAMGETTKLGNTCR